MKLTLSTPAKINLCLTVKGRRSDGYHEVEMLMQMVGLCDTVTVALGGEGIEVICDDPSVPSGEGNLAWKAAAAVREIAGSGTGLRVSIKKAIPSAAGLGGGSSDAAAVLVAVNTLLKAGLDRGRLKELGAGIGMDVPFFLHGPLAMATGRGEVLRQLPPLSKFWVLLANPGFATSTAWVYQNLNLRLTKKAGCNKIAGLTIRDIARSLHNDLQTVTAAAHPEIARIEASLMSQGALGACMSGSGPTVFGIFETEAACRSAAANLSKEGWKLYPVEALTESPLEVYHTK